MADSKDRKRMIVEEVGEPVPESKPAQEIKEKVEELQDLTTHIGEDVEKSSEVQEELVKAAEKVEGAAKIPQAPEPPPYAVEKKGFNPLLLIFIPGILLLGALLGGIYYYQKVVKTPEETPTPVPSFEPTVLPSATPSGKLDLTKYPVTIQNGSGIPGTAGSVKDLLTKAGFKVSGTGNADNYDYTDTIIKAGSSVPQEFVARLTSILSANYKVGSPQTLSGTSSDTVIVVVGSLKAQ